MSKNVVSLAAPSRRQIAAGLALALPMATIAPAASVAASGTDPIFNLIEAHRKAFKAYLLAMYEEGEKEEAINKIKERRPYALVAWRNYSAIGGSEIEDRRELFLSRGLDPATIEREYQEVRAKYEIALKKERDFDERHGLAPLIDARNAAHERAEETALALVNVKPTTMQGILALLNYVACFDAAGVVMDGNKDWYSDAQHWPNAFEDLALGKRLGTPLTLSFHSWLIRNVHEAMAQLYPAGRVA